MNLRNRALAAGLSASLVMGACFPVAALATPESELAEVSQQLEAYGTELTALQDDLANKTSELEMTSYHIGEKEAALAQTQVNLGIAKGVLSVRMRSSYKSGPSSLLTVILGADSLSDIVSRVYYMDKIAKSDARAINEVRTLENQLATEKADLEKTQADQEKAVGELQAQVDDYSTKVEEARAYYEALDAQIREQLAAQQAAAANARIQAAVEIVEGSQGQQATDGGTTNATDESGTEESNGSSEENSDSGNSSSGNGGTSYGASGGGLGSAYAAIGAPYVYGADGPSSFDCSGLVCYCYGYARGRTTYDMIDSLQSTGSWKTDMSELSVGDLVFTSEGHVGIYTGGGSMIHAPTPGKSVCETSVWSFYGGGTF